MKPQDVNLNHTVFTQTPTQKAMTTAASGVAATLYATAIDSATPEVTAGVGAIALATFTGLTVFFNQLTNHKYCNKEIKELAIRYEISSHRDCLRIFYKNQPLIKKLHDPRIYTNDKCFKLGDHVGLGMYPIISITPIKKGD